jgi:hypothetical protein
MRIKYFMLCQHAVGYENGSFSVLNGGLTGVAVPSLPAPIPLTVLLHAQAFPEEPPGHHVALTIRDEKGEVLEVPGPDGRKQKISIEANLTVQAGPNHPAGMPMPVNFIPTMPVLFERPGKYEVRCEIDGQAVSEVFVVSVNKPM